MKIIIFCFLLFVFGLANAQTDTINQVNAEGKKQGYWIIYGKTKPGSGFADSAIMEEGRYEANKKTGLWKIYYKDEMIKYQLEYKNNRPNGKFISYYVNGKVEEKGTWKQFHYVDTFYRYYPSGIPAQLKHFNSAGKTEGWSTYWFPTGEIELKFHTKNGVETSAEIIRNKSTSWKPKTISIENLCRCNLDTVADKTMLVSRKTGDTVNMFYIDFQYFVRLEGKYLKGNLFEGSCEIIKNYSSNTYAPIIRILKNGEILFYKDDKFLPFDENGDHTLYNKNKQIIETGFFKDGILIDGKKYIYDQNGLFDKIEIYKNGKYARDALPEENEVKLAPKNIIHTVEYFDECPCKANVTDTFHIIKNLKDKITLDGEFKNNQLYNGKCFQYKNDTTLFRIAIYEKGNYKCDEYILNYPYCKNTAIKDGYNKLYNSNKQLWKDGEFKNCQLYNGKQYLYDKNGLLLRILIYKNGKYFGDGQLD